MNFLAVRVNRNVRVLSKARLTSEVLMAKRTNTKEQLQRFVIYTVVALFAVHSLSTTAIFFLVGSGHLVLSNPLLMSLLASTFSEAAAVFVIISKYLFPQKPTSPLAGPRHRP